MDLKSSFPHRSYPCNECPWKRDAEPGRFPPERYEALAVTSGDGVPIDAPMFGCHQGEPGTDADLACAGWLAACGREHPAVRLAVALGRLPIEALEPGGDWPGLYGSYAELAEANGATVDGAAQPLLDGADLNADLSEYVYLKFCDTFGTFALGSERFRLASLEEGRELGYGDYDPVLLIRRESDGAFFEAEIEATARPVQQVLPGVTGQ
jgi:hypothetical protein